MSHRVLVFIWCVLTGALAMHIHLGGAGAWALFLVHTLLTVGYWQKVFKRACKIAAESILSAEQITAFYTAKLKRREDRKNV